MKLNPLLAAVSFVLAIALALPVGEAFCRLIFYISRSSEGVWSYREPGGRVYNTPNTTGSQARIETTGRSVIEINSLGFRGPHLARQKKAGVFRIFVVGDSVVFGSGVDEEKTFIGRMRPLLGSAADGRVELVNAGVQDVGTIEEADLIKKSIFRLHPDLILLGWTLNDNRPPEGFPHEVVYDSPLVNWISELEWPRRCYLFHLLIYRLAAFHAVMGGSPIISVNHRYESDAPFLARRWATSLEEFKRMVDIARYDWGNAWIPSSMKEMSQRIEDLRDATKHAGADFGVVAFPDAVQAESEMDDPYVSQPQSELADFCRREKIPFLDLLPLLKRHRKEPLFSDHCHLTSESGHPLVAEELADFITREFLPRRTQK